MKGRTRAFKEKRESGEPQRTCGTVGQLVENLWCGKGVSIGVLYRIDD